jgi:hypothetical protein
MPHVHAYSAVRAYLDLMGLPAPTDADLRKVRAALLGGAAADPANILTLSVEKDPDGTQRALMSAMVGALKKAGP